MICEAKYMVELFELGHLSDTEKVFQPTWSGFRFHLAEPKASSDTVKEAKQ